MSEFDKRFWDHDFESMAKLFKNNDMKKCAHCKKQGSDVKWSYNHNSYICDDCNVEFFKGDMFLVAIVFVALIAVMIFG